ncbi:MAG: ABC transporter permease [Anaerolineae bacterium]|nr:ABC transporter permease [Anaerolineae bacterium]
MMDVWVEPTQELHFFEILKEALGRSGDYIKLLAQGNLGTAMMVSGEIEVAEIMKTAYANSMGLIGIALGLAMFLGVLLGSLAALTKHRGQAHLVLLIAIIGISAPTFLLAVLLQTLGIKYTLTFGTRLVSMGGYAWDFEHLLMPVLVLMARPLAYVTRATYVALGEIMGADYVRTAHSKGLRERRIFFEHILRNLGIPLLTAFGVSFRFTLGVLPIVEFIFGWPGVGQYALDAVQRREAILFIVVVLALSLTIQFINALLDWLNHRIDPRLGRA